MLICRSMILLMHWFYTATTMFINNTETLVNAVKKELFVCVIHKLFFPARKFSAN